MDPLTLHSADAALEQLDAFTEISVENIPGVNAAAAFTVDSSAVFREEYDLTPRTLSGGEQYMPWGRDNLMPYNVIDLIEADETLSTCQIFNAEVCYGSGLEYRLPEEATPELKADVDLFTSSNAIPGYFLGVCQDIKHFAFAVSVIILSRDHKRINRIIRKEACYCRFAPADAAGRIPYVVYANFRHASAPTDYEVIPLLDTAAPWPDLIARTGRDRKVHKYAVLSRVPTVDSSYYPIPHYAALFRSKWYDIKRLIAVAKEAKLRNSAPIKYHIEINPRYWDSIFKAEGITDRAEQKARVVKEKQQILNFLTGAHNSGKVLFSQYYMSPDGKLQSDVVINKIDTAKEGGDWETDIQEAINMVCFAMRIHSNLVGSVPGKSQSNNSGSDKRELYTIAHALQKPYHDILLDIHRIIIRFNGWRGVTAACPFVQLTTLDRHTDARPVEM